MYDVRIFHTFKYASFLLIHIFLSKPDTFVENDWGRRENKYNVFEVYCMKKVS